MNRLELDIPAAMSAAQAEAYFARVYVQPAVDDAIARATSNRVRPEDLPLLAAMGWEVHLPSLETVPQNVK